VSVGTRVDPYKQRSRYMKERFMSNAPVAEADYRPPLESRAPQTQLLVLSRNPELVDVVRNAARTVARVAHARDLDDAVRSLSNIEPGVLLIDDANTDDMGTAIAQCVRRFPDTVMVVVGTREESNELMRLAAAGRIFRFLLMPLSYGPVRLTLAAAVTHHIECRAATRSVANVPAESASRRKHVIAYATLAALLFTIVGVLWQVSGVLAVKAPASVAAPRPAPIVAAPGVARTQLVSAARAVAEGRYVEPAGNSALDLYRAVLQSDPENETARAGMRTMADTFLQRAEQALVDERLEEAERNVLLARRVQANHPRLAFFDKSLARQHELRNLNQRLEAASRVRELVGEARSEMRAGNLIGTAAEGAVGAAMAARRLDPNDPTVMQLVRELSTELADAVRMASAAGDMPRAQAFATAARRVGAGDQLLAMIERSMREAKRAPAPPVVSPTPAPSSPVVESTTEPVRTADSTPPRTAEDMPVLQAASLPRTRQAMPSYPAAAAANGVEGFVDLEFTISTDGVPRNVVVVGAAPKRVFDAAAMSCVRQWRFEPIKQDGLPVARRATLRLRFQLK
jgi:TonB family protein